MRCSECKSEWKLSGADGPIGQAAPGHFMIVVLILAFLAGVLALQFQSWGGAAFGVVAVFFFVMAMVGSGYKEKSDGYQGSECPECGHKNKIMPWDF